MRNESNANLNQTSKSVDINKINNLIEIHRQKKYKREQLKNNIYSELGFTFKPTLNESTKYKVNGTFEERNYINFYPNRESVASKKKYGNSNKDVSSIISMSNIVNPDFNTSRISNKTFNYMNNKENSFSSKNSGVKVKGKVEQNSNTNSKNNNFLAKNPNQINENSFVSSNNNATNYTLNLNKSNISKNKSKSKTSSITNFSISNNNKNIDEDRALNRGQEIRNENFNNNNQNNKSIQDDVNKIILLKERDDLIKKINTQIRSMNSPDNQSSQNKINDIHENDISVNADQRNQEKNSENSPLNLNYNYGKTMNENRNSSNFYINPNEINGNQIMNANKNKNYGNIIYSANLNDNLQKSIKNGNPISGKSTNNQDHSNFNYSLNRTDLDFHEDL